MSTIRIKAFDAALEISRPAGFCGLDDVLAAARRIEAYLDYTEDTRVIAPSPDASAVAAAPSVPLFKTAIEASEYEAKPARKPRKTKPAKLKRAKRTPAQPAPVEALPEPPLSEAV